VKVSTVYECVLGNSRDVAQTIGDGIRPTQPDVETRCVAVGDATLVRSSARTSQ
jgi:hypothetical protein